MVVADVKVVLMRGAVEVAKPVVNDQGYFEIKNVPPGAYTLVITGPDFKTTIPLTVNDQDIPLGMIDISRGERTIHLRERDLIRVGYPDHVLEDPPGEITFQLDRFLGLSEVDPSEIQVDGQFKIMDRLPPVPAATPNVPIYQAFGEEYAAYATVTLIPNGLTVVSPPSQSELPLAKKPAVWTWKVKPTDPAAKEASFMFHVDVVWRAAGRETKSFSYNWKRTFSTKLGPPKSVTAAMYGSPVFAAFGLMTLGFGFGKRKKLFAELDRAAVLGTGVGFEELEEVSGSVFSPRQAAPGGAFVVHVFAHRPDVDAESLRATATEAWPKTQRVGTDLLDQIRQGATLTFRLSMEGLEIDNPQQSRVWTGRTISVQFGVKVPKDSEPREMFGLVVICADTMPVGHFRFKFEIVRSIAEASGIPLHVDSIERYNKAFVSYAHEDRAEVLKRVQMLSILKQKYFQDFITLRPGDKWEPSIYEAIDRSDVVYLFWSTAASGSEFVKKEILRAVERRAGDENAPPAIYPVIIEGPPPADPPAELSFLHFDDKFSYWIFAAEESSQRKDTK